MKTFDNTKDLNDYLRTEAKEGEEVCLDERATSINPRRKRFFKKPKNSKMKIEKALEKIELRLITIWWDNLMYFLWILLILLELVAMFTHNLTIVIYGFVFFIISYPIIQLFEYIQLNKIRRLYKNDNK